MGFVLKEVGVRHVSSMLEEKIRYLPHYVHLVDFSVVAEKVTAIAVFADLQMHEDNDKGLVSQDELKSLISNNDVKVPVSGVFIYANEDEVVVQGKVRIN